MAKKTGRFISFEGIDGAGKSTQIKALAAYLESRDIPILVTREPGGTDRAEKIRDMLLESCDEPWQPLGEMALHYVARLEHYTHAIKPALARGHWVLSDRFSDSTYAYQSGGQGVEKEAIDSLHHIFLGDVYPDLTIIIDIDPPTGLQRLVQDGRQPDRYEAHGEVFLAGVRAVFIQIARDNPDRCALVSGKSDRMTIEYQIQDIVKQRLL